MGYNLDKMVTGKNTRKPNLTESDCAKAKPPAKGRITLWDHSPTGLGLTITENDAKSWILKYRFNGVQRKLTIGNYPGVSLQKARDAATVALGKIVLDRDPATEQKAKKLEESGADTFKALTEKYLNDSDIKEKRSVAKDEWYIKTDLLLKWGDLKAKNITRKQVEDLVSKRSKDAPIAANRLLALIKGIFAFGVGAGMKIENPAEKVKMPSKETKGTRRLSDDEFLKVWRALDAESFIAASAYRMLALTGTRKNEVLKMKWSEINWTKNIWTIPAERVKNNHDHRVPLVGMALEILRSIKSQNHAGEYVFYGPYKDQPLEDLWKVQARILKTTEIPHYTIHNLRRTVATGLGNLDVPNLTISLILNHTSESNDGAKITGDVYNHSDYDNPKRSALIKWDAHVRELTANTPKKLLGVDDTAQGSNAA